MRITAFLKTAVAAAVTALTLCGCFANFSPKDTIPAPAIVLQPSDVRTRAGDTVVFQVSAEGEGLSYQWYYKKPDAVKWSVWTGHDTALTTSVANLTWNGMRVYCCVTDRHGRSVATRASKVSTESESSLIITAQPRSVTVNPGETAYFRIEAKGKGLQYQWYYRKGKSRLWNVWKGHTGRETSAVSNVSWKNLSVCCLVTDRSGQSVFSSSASVKLYDSPTVIAHPTPQKTPQDGIVSFSAAGGTDGLVYQWFCIPRGIKWGVKLQGQTQRTLSLNTRGGWKDGQVYCRIKTPGGRMTFSHSVPVTADNLPKVALHPASPKDGEKLTFETDADEKAARVQWYLIPRGLGVLMKLTGQTDRRISLTSSPLVTGGQIVCGVTTTDPDGSTRTLLSEPVECPTSEHIRILSQPQDAIVVAGKPASFSVKADGRGLQYQWFMKSSGDFGWIQLAGQTGSTFTVIPDGLWHNRQIVCRITNDKKESLYSRAATVTVNGLFTLTSSPVDMSARSGEKVSLAVDATGRALAYQWMRRPYGSDRWQKWQGMTDASVTLPAETDWHKMNVRCDVSDCTGKVISSESARIWIKDALDILRQPRGLTLRADEPAEFSVLAQGKGLRYQWYYKKRGTRNWHRWKNHTSSVTGALSNPTWDGMKVMCVITDEAGNKISSHYAKIHIIE